MAIQDFTIERVAQWLADAKRAVVFTGAGMSTESGIPDFRSPGGVWSQNKPVYYSDFLRSPEARFEYWRQKALAAGDFERAEPNAGHQTIARWESEGRVVGVITQNIDGLHQRAGNERVLELHGTVRWIVCVDCEARYEPLPLLDWYRQHQRVPTCKECGSERMKSATVSFGQSLPEDVLEASVELARQSDLLLAIGSSLVVYPAAGLPEIAHRSGAKLVIINRDPTDLDELADAVIAEPIGQVLTAIDASIRQLLRE
jgi:NAD-dependent deacetylase